MITQCSCRFPVDEGGLILPSDARANVGANAPVPAPAVPSASAGSANASAASEESSELALTTHSPPLPRKDFLLLRRAVLFTATGKVAAAQATATSEPTEESLESQLRSLRKLLKDEDAKATDAASSNFAAVSAAMAAGANATGNISMTAEPDDPMPEDIEALWEPSHSLHDALRRVVDGVNLKRLDKQKDIELQREREKNRWAQAPAEQQQKQANLPPWNRSPGPISAAAGAAGAAGGAGSVPGQTQAQVGTPQWAVLQQQQIQRYQQLQIQQQQQRIQQQQLENAAVPAVAGPFGLAPPTPTSMPNSAAGKTNASSPSTATATADLDPASASAKLGAAWRSLVSRMQNSTYEAAIVNALSGKPANDPTLGLASGGMLGGVNGTARPIPPWMQYANLRNSAKAQGQAGNRYGVNAGVTANGRYPPWAPPPPSGPPPGAKRSPIAAHRILNSSDPKYPDHRTVMLERALRVALVHDSRDTDWLDRLHVYTTRAVPSFRMLISPQRDFVSRTIALSGVWERKKTERIRKILQSAAALSGGPGAVTVMDVGANVGWFTLSMASWGHRVLSFEPMAQNYHLLSRSLELNPSFNVSLFPYALGDRYSVCGIYSDDINFNDGHTVCEGQIVSPRWKRRGSCVLVRADDFVREDVFLLKIDVVRAVIATSSLLHSGSGSPSLPAFSSHTLWVWVLCCMRSGGL